MPVMIASVLKVMESSTPVKNAFDLVSSQLFVNFYENS